jgi:hypothetical protein
MSEKNIGLPGIGAGMNARVTPEVKPTPSTTPRVAVPAAPRSPQFTRTSADYVDSTKPVFDIDLSKVSNGVNAALNRADRANHVANGGDGEQFDQSSLRRELARAVAEGRVTNEQASKLWNLAFPGIDPKDVK